jgi:hypothetical protein
MPRPKLRKISLDGAAYLWRIEVAYLGVRTPALRARSTFTVYLKGHKASPARLSFTTIADAQAGAPLHSGYAIAIDDDEPQPLKLNLNEPRHAASMIRLLRELGWQPELRTAFTVEDGNRYLRRLEAAAT